MYLLYLKQQQVLHFFTSRMFKLCICNVDECKVVAVRSCHIEVCFCLVNILNSKKKKNNTFYNRPAVSWKRLGSTDIHNTVIALIILEETKCLSGKDRKIFEVYNDTHDHFSCSD